MKYRLIAAIVVLLGISTTYYLRPKLEDDVHYHAGFQVYIDGVKQDFSDFKYMNFTPCSEHSHKVSKAEEQIEKAHLHDGVGDVVHVHRTGGTWGDLFKNIGYTLPSDKPIIGYVNGESKTLDVRQHILTDPILANQSINIVIGTSAGIDLTNYVSLDHIQEVESKSELCGTQKH